MATKIYIQRTEGEWQYLDQKAREMGKTDIHSAIRCQISKLQKEFKECPSCVTPAGGEKKVRKHFIPPHQLEELQKIADIMQKPLTAVVDEFVITPLLLPQDKVAAL